MSMKKRVSIWFLTMIGIMFVLAACGDKSQESVIKELDQKIEKMNGYKAKAEMTMKTGQEDQTYMIDILHKKDDYYRVDLTNEADEKGTQTILKNDDGVFVLTPALNKSFKFQTEWPNNSSQPYLFQSLVKDIKDDKDAKFETTDTHYVFKTKTNYQNNNNLPFQEIYLDKKQFTPVLVKVLDKDRNSVVEVSFSEFQLDPKFSDDDFKMPANKDVKDVQTDAKKENDNEQVEDDEQSKENEQAEDDEQIESDQSNFSVLFPLHLAGAELSEKEEIDLENGKRVILTFSGEKNFTLIQEKINDVPALSSPKEVVGDVVNIGHTIGALSKNSIEWSYDGVDYYLASEDLTKEELIEVAQSVHGKEAK